MDAKYSKLGFTLLALTVMIGSSFLVFGDVRDVAKDEGFHETLYVDVIDRADASGNSVEIFQDFRFVDNTSPTDFYDISVGSGELSFQESGTSDVLTLSNSEVKVQGSDGLCFGGTCVSDWPSTCGADEAVSWDSGAQEFDCMNISDKIDNEVTTLSAGDAINIDSNDNIDVKYGDGLTLNSDTLTIDSSACGSGEVLNYTSSGFTCVSVGGGAGAGAGQGLQKNGGDIDVGSGDGISTSADTTSVNWNDANDLDSNGDVVASRIISGDDTSVNEIWVDESSDELCYKASGESCSGTTTETCSDTDTAYYNDWRCGGDSNCDEACDGVTVCDGDTTTCSGGTEATGTSGTEVGRTDQGTTDCGGYEAPHDYDQIECECSSSQTYEQEQKSTTEQTLCVAGS